jgi:hypothetical protein
LLRQVLVLDVPEAPVFLAAPTLGVVNETSLAPTRVTPLAWFDVTRNASAVGALAFGYLLAVDSCASNTSAVSLAISTVRTIHADEVPGGMAGADGVRAVADSPHTWLVVGQVDGAPCVGGAPCGLSVAPGAPVLDYDAGLRGLVVRVVATGGTGLTSEVEVQVEVAPINEGACVCAL